MNLHMGEWGFLRFDYLHEIIRLISQNYIIILTPTLITDQNDRLMKVFSTEF